MKRLMIAFLVSVLMISAFAVSEETALTAKGYVLVYTSTEGKWFPLPDEESGEYSFTVRQTYGDTEMNNVITITPDGVYMKESDCDNQDCVEEGMVTLENKDTRVLMNMIVCLPHYLSIELYSKDEVLAMMKTSGATADDTQSASEEQGESQNAEAAK